MQVPLSVREFGNYPAHGDSSTGSELKAGEKACREASRTVEPLEPLERTDPVMNATVETIGLIFFKIVQY